MFIIIFHCLSSYDFHLYNNLSFSYYNGDIYSPLLMVILITLCSLGSKIPSEGLIKNRYQLEIFIVNLI